MKPLILAHWHKALGILCGWLAASMLTAICR